MEVLKEIGLVNDCYKIMLDCNDKNLGFYEKVCNVVKDFRMGLNFWRIVWLGTDQRTSCELS